MGYMKCRTIQNGNVVFFGSYGLNQDGTAKQASNYSEGKAGVAASLTQRLSILKGELWYRIDFGLPLTDKIKAKAIIDANVMSTILSNDDVVRIENFESTIVDKHYSCSGQVMSKYGLIDFSL